MISELNSVLFCCFQLVHIILFMSVLGSEVTFVGAALGRPQNDSKYMIPINLIASMSDSINSKRKRTTREFSGVSEQIYVIEETNRTRGSDLNTTACNCSLHATNTRYCIVIPFTIIFYQNQKTKGRRISLIVILS